MSVPFRTEPEPVYGALARVAPGIRRLMVRNPSPFTYHGTGIYVIGTGEVAVLDPGPAAPSGVNALLSGLGGETVSAILVTHTHLDHSPAAAALKAATGAPTYGFGPHGGDRGQHNVEEGADYSFSPDTVLHDGGTVHGRHWTLRAVHTPGHTSNHLCYHFVERNTLFSGDHVMGWSTTVVSPPDGDMIAYMRSLEKLLSRRDDRYFPTHGAAIEDPPAYVRALLDHRRGREEQIMACMRDAPATIADIVDRLYADVPKNLHPAAARSVLAHLIKLVAEDRVEMTPGTSPERADYRAVR